jgi:hypothetical protein
VKSNDDRGSDTSKTLANIDQATWHYNPEDSHFNVRTLVQGDQILKATKRDTITNDI